MAKSHSKQCSPFILQSTELRLSQLFRCGYPLHMGAVALFSAQKGIFVHFSVMGKTKTKKMKESINRIELPFFTGKEMAHDYPLSVIPVRIIFYRIVTGFKKNGGIGVNFLASDRTGHTLFRH